MDRLWAPWRYNYIKKQKEKKSGRCLFCGIAKSKNDKKNLIFLRGRYSFCVLNAFPYNNGHVMVVPYRHIYNLKELKDTESLDLIKLLNHTINLLDRSLGPKGYNIGINIGRNAGAGLMHMHIHIVPRWRGDSNFMPIIYNTKIISQSLDELYRILTHAH